MKKHIGSVVVNTESGQLFQNGQLVHLPYDIAKAYEVYCTFEYLKDNYTNDDETLWQIATETRALMREVDYPLSENEAIEKACISLNITLEEA